MVALIGEDNTTGTHGGCASSKGQAEKRRAALLNALLTDENIDTKEGEST